MNHPPEIIEVPPIRLRRASPADATALFNAAANPDVMRYMDWLAPKTVQEIRTHLESVVESWSRGVEFQWIIEDIEDRYILNTRLRLRKVTESGRSPIYKLGKKYESESSGTHQVVTTYLTENEYSVFARLPAKIARKRRCSLYGGSLDVYEHLEVELQVFEIEFASVEEAAAYVPPPFVGREITSETKYSGFALARGEAYP